MFTQEQLTSSLRATILLALAINAAVIVDVEQLHKDILTALPADSIAQSHLSDTSDPRWSKDLPDSCTLMTGYMSQIPMTSTLEFSAISMTTH